MTIVGMLEDEVYTHTVEEDARGSRTRSPGAWKISSMGFEH